MRQYYEQHDNDDKLTIREFRETLKRSARSAIGTLLARSGRKPNDDCTLAELTAHEQFLREQDEKLAKQFYDNHLFPRIKKKCVAGSSLEPLPRALISVVSSPAIIAIATQFFQFDNVLILYTVPFDDSVEIGDSDLDSSHINQWRQAILAKNMLEEGSRKVVPILQRFKYDPSISGDQLRKSLVVEISNAVHETKLLNQYSTAGEVMWDLSSGLRIFSHVLEKGQGLAREGDWLLNLNHAWSSKTERRIPFTESLVVWKKGEDWRM